MALHTRAYRQISPIDEFQHIDYLDKVTHFQLVPTGTLVGELAMRAESCRGVDLGGYQPPPCDGPHLPAQYPGLGVDSADIHSPLYYFITGWGARAATTLGVVRDLVLAARLLGSLWLGTGLILIWILAREAGASVGARAGVVAFLGASPGVLYMFSIVNPDATTLATGAILLLACRRWEAGRWPLLVLVLAGVVTVIFKSTNVLAVLATAIYLVWHQPEVIEERDVLVRSGPVWARVSKSRLLAAGALLATTTLAQAVWLVIRRLLVGNRPQFVPMSQALHVTHLRLGKVMDAAAAMVFPTNWLPPLIKPIPLTWDFQLLGALMVGASLGAILFAQRRGYLQSLGVAAWASLVVGGPIIVILTFISQQTFFELSARYGFSLLPLFAVATAVAVRGRALTALLLALAAIAVVTDVGNLTQLMRPA